MAYELKSWIYAQDSDMERVIDAFKKSRRLTVLVDDSTGEGFFIVGNGRNEDMDLAQGRLLLDFVNSEDFPKV